MGEDRAEDVPGIRAGSSVEPSIVATIGKTAGKHGRASGVAIVEHRHLRPAAQPGSGKKIVATVQTTAPTVTP